jgi:AraC-like DNA-binding protein
MLWPPLRFVHLVALNLPQGGAGRLGQNGHNARGMPSADRGIPASRFQERPPPAALAGIVTCSWIQHIPIESSPYVHTSTPDGSVEIAYRLGDRRGPQLIGPRTRPTQEVLPPGATTVGIRFRPGASVGVVGMPASELVDQTVDLRDVWGSPADRLADELGTAHSPNVLAALLVGAVHRESIGTAGPDPIAQLIVRSLRQNAQRLTDIGHLVGLSKRQVRRRCVAAVGYGPKTLQRIARFQQLLAVAHTEVDERLADLAVERGYADQAHLNSESRRLTGLPPATFIAEMRESCASHDHRASMRTWLAVGRAKRAG